MGAVFRPVLWIKDEFNSARESYFDLVGVKEENLELRRRVQILEAELESHREDRFELRRLYELISLKEAADWRRVGARVLAARFGPFSAQETVMIDKGYVEGAIPGTPVATTKGVFGKVMRSARNTSTVLLLTDPGFRVAVVSSETRTPGILAGTGPLGPLELRYVAQNSQIKEGEMLLTSGVAGGFPYGLPVGTVTSVKPAGSTLFVSVLAQPLVRTDAVEEVLLLFPPSRNLPLGFLPPKDSSVEMEAETHKLINPDAANSGSGFDASGPNASGPGVSPDASGLAE